jgi:hypothetical protein
MNKDDIAKVMAKPIAQHLLLDSPIPARLAYVGVDGDPRVVPVGFLWDGEKVSVGSAVTSAKVEALRQNPRVAITIDTEDLPPRVLLIRGAAKVEVVDGVAEEFIKASKKRVPDEVWEGWLQGQHALYSQMALITIEPDWAKLIDFETTIPKAQEDMIRARQG